MLLSILALSLRPLDNKVNKTSKVDAKPTYTTKTIIVLSIATSEKSMATRAVHTIARSLNRLETFMRLFKGEITGLLLLFARGATVRENGTCHCSMENNCRLVAGEGDKTSFLGWEIGEDGASMSTTTAAAHNGAESSSSTSILVFSNAQASLPL